MQANTDLTQSQQFRAMYATMHTVKKLAPQLSSKPIELPLANPSVSSTVALTKTARGEFGVIAYQDDAAHDRSEGILDRLEGAFWGLVSCFIR